MFDPAPTPHIFAMPPGVDFAAALVAGVEARLGDAPPEAWARVEIYVNTARMRRRVRAMFDQGPARLLPRIRLVTELADDPVAAGLPPAIAPLRRRLELTQLIGKLLEQEPDLAPRAALFDLADSLAKLMDEMQGEGVGPEVLEKLDVTDQSGHWDRALRFLRIIAPYFAGSDTPPDREARQRQVIAARAAEWAVRPPDHPVIVAGSTGSRGATALFMQAVAALPQGALVLPGFDFDLPQAVWDAMVPKDPWELPPEDHPQYRFRHLMDVIGFAPKDVKQWGDTPPAHPERNALISLSLRPAPVTDAWRRDGPSLGDLMAATEGMTLVEAPSPRAEAEVIALRLRQAAEDGQTAALISPDRMLTRQVTAALDRWGITPDDSAGMPLLLSAPGRFLRHVAGLYGQKLTGEALLVLLKHPLCHSAHPERGDHLRYTRELELHLRRYGPPFPTVESLTAWAGRDETRQAWVGWFAPLVTGLADWGERPLSDCMADLLARAEALSAGPGADGAGELWDKAAGREAARLCANLTEAAEAAGAVGPRDFAAILSGVLAEGTVRDRDAGHPGILIWGTLEARVHGVDLTILGGMNDGTWPEAPPPDPWLNRSMRVQAGLLLPERRIGLSAHDYQQAVAGKEVWITRAKRSADAETVPSRWINRLTNLLGGLPGQNGPEALKAMQDRGDHWLAMAAALSSPTTRSDPAPRPSPCPPVTARPDTLSVTQIKILIRDPFALYGRKILRLKKLDPLQPSADAQLRGTVFHSILERFIAEGHGPTDRDALMQITREELDAGCPWPTVHAMWLAKMARSADLFLEGEAARQQLATPNPDLLEISGEIVMAPSGVTLVGKADRIDVTEGGDALIYDYKTGQIPSKPVQRNFDKQLLIEAAMVERGAFDKLGARPVANASFIGVNADMKVIDAPMDEETPDQTWEFLENLLMRWQDPARGYTARFALMTRTDPSDYDHLSRFGEWDTSDEAVPEVLT